MTLLALPSRPGLVVWLATRVSIALGTIIPTRGSVWVAMPHRFSRVPPRRASGHRRCGGLADGRLNLAVITTDLPVWP